MEFQFKQILLKKYAEDKIPNFVILHGPIHNFNFDHALQKWAVELFKEIIQKSGTATNPLDHPDILFLNQISDKSSLIKSADLDHLKDFLKFKPMSLTRKFIFIRDIYNQQIAVLNKLLKVLEDAPIELTIIASNPNSVSSISTIKSRAVHFRFNEQSLRNLIDKNNPESERDRDLQFSSISNIQTNLKSLEQKEVAKYFEDLYRSLSRQDYKTCQGVLEILKNYQMDKNYNLSKGFTSFLTYQLAKKA